MRNLAAGNKTNFTIFIVIVILILVLLTFAVITVLRYEKEEYDIPSSEFIYDSKYNYINLEDDAKISKKWTGSYYLKENSTKKEYKLGNFVVAYNKNRALVDMFGKFYQVSQGGIINKISGYNTTNGLEEKFYKIDDRKYLIIGNSIKNNKGSLSTSSYLLIIIDKLGNALLLNNQINIKTINNMTISTNTFDFDVANETLKFKDDNKIDLKKIIGSTNEYIEVKEEVDSENNTEIAKTEDNNKEINNSSNINNTNKSTTIQGGTTNGKTKWVDSLNGWIGNVSNAFESIYNQNKNTKNNKDDGENKNIILNSVNAGTTFLEINYTINDPENKYNVVYANISKENYNKTVSLDKNANVYRFGNLTPDSNYTVSIGYKLINSDSSTEESEEESMTIKTSKPDESLVITKITQDKLYYTLKLDSLYKYDEGAKITIEAEIINEDNQKKEFGETIISLNEQALDLAASKGYTGSFDLNKIKGYSWVVIKLEDTYYEGSQASTNLKAKIINYK